MHGARIVQINNKMKKILILSFYSTSCDDRMTSSCQNGKIMSQNDHSFDN